MSVRARLSEFRDSLRFLNRREEVAAGFIVAALLLGAALAVLQRSRVVRLSSACPVAVVRIDSSVPTALPAGPLNLNSATARQLEALPGIGPTLAQRVLQLREQLGGFTSVAQLRRVSGIGPKRYAALRDLVVVAPPSAETSGKGQ